MSPDLKHFDVFIVGAGPAGAALAIALKQIAPAVSIGLAAPDQQPAFRIGESVPPLIKPFLAQLGLETAFTAAGHSQTFCTLSAWGGAELISNEFIYQVHNTGWRLDRANFDAMLLSAAERGGAERILAKIAAVKHEPQLGFWQISSNTGTHYTARFLVDASGQKAVILRLLGLKPQKLDKLVASTVFFAAPDAEKPSESEAALIESTPVGWWYTVKTPDARRVAMLMTDSDLARQLNLAEQSVWQALLSETQHIKCLLNKYQALTPPCFWPAASHFSELSSQEHLLAVGDALAVFDPLSSQGIIKALRSAILASYALADVFLQQHTHGIRRYNAIMQREFSSYWQTRSEFYAQETRWPEAEFWRRRQSTSRKQMA